MIPKRIFFAWGKEQPLSFLRYLTLKTFCDLNPKWDVTLFEIETDVKVKTWPGHYTQDFFNFKGVDYSPKLKDLPISIKTWVKPEGLPEKAGPQHLSNFLKYHELSENGGIYSDMDVLWVKPIDDFYNRIKEYNAAICKQPINKGFAIGLLASAPHSPVFKGAFDEACLGFTLGQYLSAGPHTFDRMGFKSIQDIIDKYNGLSVYNIPMNLIYNWDYTNLKALFEETYPVPEETIGLHWYAANPIAQEYNNNVTHENFEDYPCTVSQCIGCISLGDQPSIDVTEVKISSIDEVRVWLAFNEETNTYDVFTSLKSVLEKFNIHEALLTVQK